MASVHKDPRGKSKYWFVSYRLPDGRQRTRSTRQTNYKMAERVRIQIELSLEKAKNKIFTATQAKKALDDILESLGQNPIKSVTTGEFLDSWLEQYSEGKPKTYERYKGVLTDFKTSFDEKMNLPLDATTPSDFEAFKKLQLKEGKSAGSVNTSLKILRAAFNYARKQGYILTNPTEAVNLLKKEGNSHDDFTTDQIQSLLDVSEWEWKGMVLLGAYLGIRIGDAAKITWNNVDLQNGLLTHRPSKTLKLEQKPIVGSLLTFLEQIPVGIKEDSPLFPNLHTKQVSGSNGLSEEFNWLMQKAGIERKAKTKNVKGKGRQFFGLGFHSLRSSATSTMANQGVSEELRMKIIGHQSKSVHALYTNHEQEILKKAASVIPTFKI